MADDAGKEDEINVSEFADMIIERFSTINYNEAEAQFRGRMASTMISMAAHLKHLDEEVKALKASRGKGISGGTF